MSYTKEQLIEISTPALVKSTASTTRQVKNVLETYTAADLNIELARQRKAGLVFPRTPQVEPQQVSSSEQAILDTIRAEVQRRIENDPERIRRQEEDERQAEAIYKDYYLSQMFAIPVTGHGFAIRNRGSEQIILGWLNPGETLSREFLVTIIQENPSLASQLQWRSVNPKQAEARQEELDKQKFVEAAKELRSFGVNEANFKIIRQTLGSGFSVYRIQQLLTANGASLSRPTQQELDQWESERIEQQNETLQKMDPEQLRARVRQEAGQRRSVDQQAEADEAFAAVQARDAARGGFPPLPPEITSEVIRKATPDQIKFWIKKYSNSNVTARLQGRD